MNPTISKTETQIASLLLGAEVWADCDGDFVRRDAVPSIDEIDGVVGRQRGPLAGRVAKLAADKRSPQIDEAEGVAVLAWPVLDRDQVNAVVVCYFASDGASPLGLEQWEGRPGRSELCLAHACYAGLDRFSRLSPHIAFPKGAGLPGMAWESGLPNVLQGLGTSPSFMRASTAASEGLDVGLALPLTAGNALRSVVLLLSGADRPIARVAEVWTPRTRGDSLRLGVSNAVYPDAPETQRASERGLDLPAGDGWIGRAWASRKPELIYSDDGVLLGREGAQADGLRFGLALPMITLDDVRSLVVLMW